MAKTPHWWDDHSEIAAFLIYWIDEHPGITPAGVVAIVEKPWKWTEEYLSWNLTQHGN